MYYSSDTSNIAQLHRLTAFLNDIMLRTQPLRRIKFGIRNDRQNLWNTEINKTQLVHLQSIQDYSTGFTAHANQFLLKTFFFFFVLFLFLFLFFLLDYSIKVILNHFFQHLFKLNNSVEKIPYWATYISTATQRNSQHCVENESSLPHSKQHATCPYHKPNQSSPCCHPTS